jgi:hypothetical protein
VDINERIINESSDVPHAVTAQQLMKVRSTEASDFFQAATRFTKTESSLAAKCLSTSGMFSMWYNRYNFGIHFVCAVSTGGIRIPWTGVLISP